MKRLQVAGYRKRDLPFNPMPKEPGIHRIFPLASSDDGYVPGFQESVKRTQPPSQLVAAPYRHCLRVAEQPLPLESADLAIRASDDQIH